jgi:S-adenosylmethionine decarboxylase proenzyme
MYSENSTTPGKVLISNIKNIKNMTLMNDVDGLQLMLDYICEKYNFTILNKKIHEFEPIGITIIYMLSESHLTIHTFPERKYIAFDLYTCRNYENNEIYKEIHKILINEFEAEGIDSYDIVDRHFE